MLVKSAVTFSRTLQRPNQHLKHVGSLSSIATKSFTQGKKSWCEGLPVVGMHPITIQNNYTGVRSFSSVVGLNSDHVAIQSALSGSTVADRSFSSSIRDVWDGVNKHIKTECKRQQNTSDYNDYLLSKLSESCRMQIRELEAISSTELMPVLLDMGIVKDPILLRSILDAIEYEINEVKSVSSLSVSNQQKLINEIVRSGIVKNILSLTNPEFSNLSIDILDFRASVDAVKAIAFCTLDSLTLEHFEKYVEGNQEIKEGFIVEKKGIGLIYNSRTEKLLKATRYMLEGIKVKALEDLKKGKLHDKEGNVICLSEEDLIQLDDTLQHVYDLLNLSVLGICAPDDIADVIQDPKLTNLIKKIPAATEYERASVLAQIQDNEEFSKYFVTAIQSNINLWNTFDRALSSLWTQIDPERKLIETETFRALERARSDAMKKVVHSLDSCEGIASGKQLQSNKLLEPLQNNMMVKTFYQTLDILTFLLSEKYGFTFEVDSYTEFRREAVQVGARTANDLATLHREILENDFANQCLIKAEAIYNNKSVEAMSISKKLIRGYLKVIKTLSVTSLTTPHNPYVNTASMGELLEFIESLDQHSSDDIQFHDVCRARKLIDNTIRDFYMHLENGKSVILDNYKRNTVDVLFRLVQKASGEEISRLKNDIEIAKQSLQIRDRDKSDDRILEAKIEAFKEKKERLELLKELISEFKAVRDELDAIILDALKKSEARQKTCIELSDVIRVTTDHFQNEESKHALETDALNKIIRVYLMYKDTTTT